MPNVKDHLNELEDLKEMGTSWALAGAWMKEMKHA